jgi:2-polyprenyl-3-methyl-5-hydroxy-6-metoxy-1,4-benzoquinol methylase
VAEQQLVDFEVGSRTLVLEQLRADDLAAAVERPLWARVWPCSRWLAQKIATADELAGMRVLDLGCGVGPLGLAAATKGAHVLLGDIEEEALAMAQRNAERNQLTVETRLLDFNQPPADLGRFDLILGADILYVRDMLPGVTRFVAGHLAPEGRAWIADPVRMSSNDVRVVSGRFGLEFEQTIIPAPTKSGVVAIYEFRLKAA